jgi:hypothetical protein
MLDALGLESRLLISYPGLARVAVIFIDHHRVVLQVAYREIPMSAAKVWQGVLQLRLNSDEMMRAKAEGTIVNQLLIQTHYEADCILRNVSI